MKRPLNILLSAALLIAVAGIIKFNFLDTPYDGVPITYLTVNGETVSAHFKTDNSVEISGHDFDTISLTPAPSASGSRYSNPDESFVFWTQGNEGLILKNDIVTFRGSKEIAPKSALAGSIWKYTGSVIDGEQLPVVSGTLIILNFDNNRLFGEASCNSFFGSYQHSQETPDKINFSDLGASMALCEDEVMAQEDRFLSALASTTSIALNENNLTLHSGSNTSLQFKLFGSQQ